MSRTQMKVSRRALLASAAACLAAPRAVADAAGPITLIVPFAAGGPTDIVARLAAEGMARRLARTIIVENVAGAGGATGTLRVARARPDGSTMVLGQMATHALTPILNAAAGYDPVNDFEPIGLIANAPMVLAARKGVPAGSLQEFRDFVRANGGRLSFGHAGLGATSNVACELFNVEAMAMPASVPYRGTAPALNDLAAGQIDYVCDQLTSVAPLIRSGHIQGVTLMAGARSPVLPDLPSSAEQGFPGLAVEVWNGLLFPKGAPIAAVQAANTALLAALADAELLRRFEELGATVPAAAANTPAAFGALIRSENERWRPVLQRIR
jgi:tripartite-type tricarboxylate transporter receptor subunit TctC